MNRTRRIFALVTLAFTVACVVAANAFTHVITSVIIDCNSITGHAWSFPLGPNPIHALVRQGDTVVDGELVGGTVVFDGDLITNVVKTEVSEYGPVDVPVKLTGHHWVAVLFTWGPQVDGGGKAKFLNDVDNTGCAPPVTQPPVVVERVVEVPVEHTTTVEHVTTVQVTTPAPPPQIVTKIVNHTQKVSVPKIIRQVIHQIKWKIRKVVVTRYTTVPTAPKIVYVPKPIKVISHTPPRNAG